MNEHFERGFWCCGLRKSSEKKPRKSPSRATRRSCERRSANGPAADANLKDGWGFEPLAQLIAALRRLRVSSQLLASPSRR